MESAKQTRIAKQIEPDGKQPLELARTKSWSYGTMNLDGTIQLANLGDAAGIDLWSFQTSDGRSIRKAIEYLLPFAKGEKKWAYEQIEEVLPEKLFTDMRQAAPHYRDENFKRMMSGVPGTEAGDAGEILGN